MIDHLYYSKKPQNRPSRTVNVKEKVTFKSGTETCGDDSKDVSTVSPQVEEYVLNMDHDFSSMDSIPGFDKVSKDEWELHVLQPWSPCCQTK